MDFQFSPSFSAEMHTYFSAKFKHKTLTENGNLFADTGPNLKTFFFNFICARSGHSKNNFLLAKDLS